MARVEAQPLTDLLHLRTPISRASDGNVSLGSDAFRGAWPGKVEETHESTRK